MQPLHGHPSESVPAVPWARRIADLLTAGRLVIAFWLLVLGRRHAPVELLLLWALLVALIGALGGRLRNTVGDFIAGLPPAARHWLDACLPRWLGGRVQQERRQHGPPGPPP